MKKLLPSIVKIGVVTLLVTFLANWANAVPKSFLPFVITQPDGKKISCFVSGDEFHNWVHDADGYTIMRNPKNGYWVYAIEENGKLTPSDYVVGVDKPSASKGLEPYANISVKEYLKKRKDHFIDNHYISLVPSKSEKGIAPLKTTKGEVLNNIVVFIKFADQTVDSEDYSYYSDIYNGSSSSVADYYNSVSYGQFTISSTFYPAPSGGYVTWYTDSHNRNYYQPYDATTNPDGYDPDATSSTNTSSQTYREHTLLKNAIDAVSANIPTSINIDLNNDDYVDVVSFIVAGANDGWNDLLWPHQWSLYSQDAYINGKQVGDYTFQLQLFYNARIDLGTLCHEMFHVIGAPDLYQYSDNSTISPVGKWDLMEGTLDYPQNMGAYMKYLYGGWISNIPTISESGTYTLNPLSTSATGNAYIIPSPNTYWEYFLVEYRNNNAYDRDLPGTGMLVYRINLQREGYGNADADNETPNEVYIYRPYGTTTANGVPNSAAYSSASSRTAINDQTSPSSFLSDGTAGGLNISNVTSASSTISFDAAINFVPWVMLKNDIGYYNGFNFGTNTTTTIATRFTTDDFTGLIGENISKVLFYLLGNQGVNTMSKVVIKVWEGGSYGNPGTLILSDNVTSEVKIDTWTTHELSTPIEIKDGKEYWIGYEVTFTTGHPFAIDPGPMVSGKGGWILTSGQWKELSEIGLDYNILIRAVIGDEATAVPSSTVNDFGMKVYPNPINQNSVIQIEMPVSGSASVDVYNMLGQLVWSAPSAAYASGEQSISLSKMNLSKGVYLCKVIMSTGSTTKQQTETIIVN